MAPAEFSKFAVILSAALSQLVPISAINIASDKDSLVLMLKLKLQYVGHLMRRTDSLEKTLMLGKIEGRRRTEDEMIGWHHQSKGHEFEQALGVGDG